MGLFGWSYPPGCSGPPDDEEGPCQGCGASDLDNCILAKLTSGRS